MGSPVPIPGPDEENRLEAGQPAQLWKNLFEISPDAQVVCRLDGKVEQANPRAIAFLKLNLNGAQPVSIFHSLLPPADQRLKEMLRHPAGQPNHLNSAAMFAPGASCGLIDLEVAPLGTDRALIIVRDAGRRLRLESHVRRLITAIDSTPEAFFITDSDLRITFVNPAFQATTGYSIEEVLSRADAFLRAPGEHEKVKTYLDQVRQGREWTGELTNVRRNGTHYLVESTLSPICDMTGRFMGYVACERDMTVRVRLQNELRGERDFIRSILTSLDSAIYTMDRDFRLTHANDGWRRLPAEHGGINMEGPPEAGRSLLDSVPDRDRAAELRRLFQEVLNTGHAQEHRYCSPDSRHWLVKISPWVHAGEVNGLICSVADQTHYHELQNQLFQAQKMEIIGTLAAGVAHDFNNLLQAIRGNVSLMLMQAAAESNLHHWAEQINIAASRAADITQQLLTFSRESGEQRTVLDLNAMVREAGQLARRTLRADIILDLVPFSEALPVKVDPTRANQALLNLCVNAQDAMPRGGRLTVTTMILSPSAEQRQRHSLTGDGEFACCSVSDTGVGIPSDVITRIFDPFFTTKEKGKGTGLGLPIVQRVVKEAGGFVDVESVPGHGTTFRLYFPLTREELTAAETAAERTLARGTGRVLVVDDVDLLRDFSRSFLKAAGLSVVVATNGKEALEILGEMKEPIDLLFTDYSMPGMNGIELIERVAAQWPEIRLVLSSGYLDEPAHKRLQTQKVTVLCKPYDMRQAAEVIVRLLADKAS